MIKTKFSLILMIILLSVIIEIHLKTKKCPRKKPKKCSNAKQRTCGYKSNGTPVKMYANKCKACKAKGVQRYEKGSCKKKKDDDKDDDNDDDNDDNDDD